MVTLRVYQLYIWMFGKTEVLQVIHDTLLGIKEFPLGKYLFITVDSGSTYN